MIKLPRDYETARAYDGTSVPQLTPGGHICRTRSVELGTSRNGNEMLKVYFDITAAGEFNNYYQNLIQML